MARVVAAVGLVGAAGAIGRFATSTLLFSPPVSDTRFGEVPWEGAFGGGNELLRLWASALLSHLADVQRCSGRTSTT